MFEQGDCDPEITGCMGDCGIPEHDEIRDVIAQIEVRPPKRLVCAVCELPAGTCSHPANHVKEA